MGDDNSSNQEMMQSSSKAVQRSVFFVNSVEEALQNISEHEQKYTVKDVYHYKKKDFGETG